MQTLMNAHIESVRVIVDDTAMVVVRFKNFDARAVAGGSSSSITTWLLPARLEIDFEEDACALGAMVTSLAGSRIAKVGGWLS